MEDYGNIPIFYCEIVDFIKKLHKSKKIEIKYEKINAISANYEVVLKIG